MLLIPTGLADKWAETRTAKFADRRFRLGFLNQLDRLSLLRPNRHDHSTACIELFIQWLIDITFAPSSAIIVAS